MLAYEYKEAENLDEWLVTLWRNIARVFVCECFRLWISHLFDQRRSERKYCREARLRLEFMYVDFYFLYQHAIPQLHNLSIDLLTTHFCTIDIIYFSLFTA